MKRGAASDPNWYVLGWQTWLLGLEASRVIASRLARIASGGAQARRECELMVREKTEAGAELQQHLARLGPGMTAEAAMSATLKHYRRKVAANNRRLSR
ncbi:MAG: hypothetical protein EON93_05210 [Burkholderiales bacterium]|nr:MAG: hypothetical protein EON93_05210 [Burkholderiales bacterium]